VPVCFGMTSFVCYSEPVEHWMLALASCDARMPVSVRGTADVALTAPPACHHTCALWHQRCSDNKHCQQRVWRAQASNRVYGGRTVTSDGKGARSEGVRERERWGVGFDNLSEISLRQFFLST